MANRCDFCGKGRMIGRNVSFSKQRTRKIQRPNLHTIRLLINGQKRKLKLCTKCLRKAKKKYQTPVQVQKKSNK